MTTKTNDQIHRFRLVDAMVLIAMLALGLAMAVGPFRGTDPEMIIVVGGADYRVWNLAKYYGALLFPCITPLTFALPLLGLKQRRGSLATVFLRPGLGGCVAASAALVLRGLEYLPYYLRDAQWHLGPIEPWFATGEKVGYAVLGLWATLALVARWRIRRGWLEHTGLVVSAIWTAGAVGAVIVVLRIRGGEWLRSIPWLA